MSNIKLNIKDSSKVAQVVKRNKHSEFSCHGCAGTVGVGAVIYQIVHAKKKRVLAKLCSQRCVDGIITTIGDST